MEEVKTKRETALLIPYKIVNGTIFVFLQKRNKDSKILPDHFSFFGGKLEPGEGKEEALKREIQEELNFELKEYSFLNTYDSFEGGSIILNVHFTKVSDDFDETVTVSEGQYGKFLAVSVGGLLLASGLLFVMVDTIGLHDVLAKFLIAIVVMFWNFSLNKFWTFR